MRNGHTRFAVAALALAVFWILVYWSAPAARDGGVRMAAANEAAALLQAPSQASKGAPTKPTSTPESGDRRLALRDDGARRDGSPQTNPGQSDALTALAQRAPAPPPATEPRAGVVAPRFREHVVRPGQTMLTIAKEVFGDSKKWEAISRANPKVDPLKLRAGAKLRIPLDPTNVQGKDLPAPERAQAKQDEGALSGAKPATYTVKSGDTLGGIAKRTLGSSAAWEDLLRANRSILDEPEDLRPGITLTIPAR